jgi:hypothetical protein
MKTLGAEYGTLQNHSGSYKVKDYELKPDGIIVQFADGEDYCYSHTVAGNGHVENMKQLAISGSGLGKYIAVLAK